MIEVAYTCILCRQPTLNLHAPFCAECSPVYGQVVDLVVDGERYAIYVGKIDLATACYRRRNGIKIIRMWVGTDVLLLHRFPPGRGGFSVMRYRIKDQIVNQIVHEHWINGERLFNEFVAVTGRRNVKMIHWLGKNFVANKVAHDGINVAYYHPRDDKYSRWVYGVDVMEKVIDLDADQRINFIALDGRMNMKNVYPILDGYIRPTRHDGWPRMVHECQMNNIPFYWSMESLPPTEFVCENPSIKDIQLFIETLKK